MTRPRVALVGWRLGGELEHAIRLGRERIDYTVVSMELDQALRPLVDWVRIPWPALDSFRVAWATFFSLAGRRLARMDADLVHAIGPLPVVPNRVDLNTVTFCQAAYAEATAGNPTKGSASAVGWRLGQRFAVGVERWWFARRVRTLLAISEGSAADLRRLYPGVPVTVLPRGIDLRRFRPDDDDRRRVRAEHGVPEEAVVALFVDQQHRPLKGLSVAIRAFAAARASGGPDLLWIVGAGADHHAALAHELGVGDRVRFLGYTAQVDRYYRGADIFLLPTLYEAFCRAAHEAAASGLPVVAPKVNGISELVGNDEAGIIARRDPADLAAALARLSSDPAMRARMASVGREHAQAFDLELVAQRVVALHEAMLSRRAPPGTPA